ncbi:DUF4344 domain-containing metallopeptidase [Nocardia vinacea]|uniref:DUF4344 domain-containing metallopeptidase n=1 Tax=Nocardia vinacea TaxID=96468 RepID=UPI0002DCA0A8|nr:DUF4344 domain-containing metallopeptidase [Nocardia vinacea]
MIPKWCRWAGAVAILAATTTACSSDNDGKPASQGTTSAATTSKVADTGKFVPKYERAMASDLAKEGKTAIQDNKVLEELTDALGTMYKLPKDIPVIAKECGEFNAYWDPKNQSLILCYEMFAVAERYAKLQAANPANANYMGTTDIFNLYFDGVTRMITFHESAHMAINLYSLPATGREEDSADQLGALVLLTIPGPLGAGSVAAAADFWFDISDDPASLDARSFADEHSLDQVRAYNLECWAYGSNPNVLDALVNKPGEPEKKGYLPYQRAAGCPDEYTRMKAAWETLLKPYIETSLGAPTTAGNTPGATPSSTTQTHSTTPTR